MVIWFCFIARMTTDGIRIYSVISHLIRRQHGRVVSASDLQSGSPRFESCSGELLELLSVVLSSNLRPLLYMSIAMWLPPASWGFWSCYAVFELLFVSKYLSGVPVNQLDKLSALSTINKPLNHSLKTFYITIVVMEAPLGSNQSERSNICLDQSASSI